MKVICSDRVVGRVYAEDLIDVPSLITRQNTRRTYETRPVLLIMLNALFYLDKDLTNFAPKKGMVELINRAKDMFRIAVCGMCARVFMEKMLVQTPLTKGDIHWIDTRLQVIPVYRQDTDAVINNLWTYSVYSPCITGSLLDGSRIFADEIYMMCNKTQSVLAAEMKKIIFTDPVYDGLAGIMEKLNSIIDIDYPWVRSGISPEMKLMRLSPTAVPFTPSPKLNSVTGLPGQLAND